MKNQSLSTLRSVEVDYAYIDNLFLVYKTWLSLLKEGSKDAEKYLDKIKLDSIPFVNVFLSRATKRYKFKGNPELFEDLFIVGWEIFISDISRKLEYPDSSRFFSYHDLRLVNGISQYYFKTYNVGNVIYSDELEMYNLSYTQTDKIIQSSVYDHYFNLFTCYLPDKYIPVIQYVIDLHFIKDQEIKENIIVTRFNISQKDVGWVVKKAKIIYKNCLFFSLTEKKEPKSLFKKKGASVTIDKLHLLLLTLESRNTGLVDLYYHFGDDLLNLIRIFGGQTIAFPTLEEYDTLLKNISIITEIYNNPTQENIDIVAAKYNTTRREIGYLLDLFKNKFKTSKYLLEIITVIDNLYREKNAVYNNRNPAGSNASELSSGV